MMQSMKGATSLLAGMNKQMNLPALQRIAQEFERENDIMDQRNEMMDDVIDDVVGLEDEEEGEEVVNQVLDEIGIDLGQAVCLTTSVWITCELIFGNSSERRLLVCQVRQYRRRELRRLLMAEMPAMTIYKQGWTAYASRMEWADSVQVIEVAFSHEHDGVGFVHRMVWSSGNQRLGTPEPWRHLSRFAMITCLALLTA